MDSAIRGKPRAPGIVLTLRMAIPNSNWISLRSAELSAEIDPLGAQLSTLRDAAGRDLLWNGDASVWNGRAPLLFPIVGALAGGAYRLNSKSYRLPRHGFARGRAFSVVAADAAQALFRLTSDAATQEVFPFLFELEVRYALEDNHLSIITSVRNPGPDTLLASFGYHPAFRWPLPYGQPRAAHFVTFAEDEPAPIRRLDGEGLMTATRHPTPVRQRHLALADDLFKDDVVIFDALRSRSVTYGAEAGPKIQVSFAGSPFFGLWTKPGAQFICIEPWHGVADPEGFSGDFAAKPGVFSIAAGAVRPIEMIISLLKSSP
jgi:galactose mutarotase-like enzyme